MRNILFVLIIFSSFPFVFAQDYPDLGVKVETVAENLKIPWSIAWSPAGTIVAGYYFGAGLDLII